MESNSPKLWAIVTIAVSVVGCVGTVLGAFIGAPWLEKVIFPSPTPPGIPVDTQPVDPQPITPTDDFRLPPTATLRPSPTPFYDINLLYNGDFADGITGWEHEVKDEGGSGKIQVVSFPSTRNKKGLYLSQTGKGAVAVYQSVPIENVVDVRFMATFRMENQNAQMLLVGGGGCLLGLNYKHSDDTGDTELLGASYWINYDISMLDSIGPMGGGIRDTNSVHYIEEVEGGNVYIEREIIVQDEIQSNLLAITPDEINQIDVIAYCSSTTNENATMSLTLGDLILAEKRR